VGELFSGAFGLIRTILTLVTFVGVMFLVGVTTHKGSNGIAAIGFGIGQTLIWAVELIVAIFKGLSLAVKSL
jgi:hypothetical protein